MKHLALLSFVISINIAAAMVERSPSPKEKVRLSCNTTLKSGSTLTLTEKLDLSGRNPNQPDSIDGPCYIVGPNIQPPATIIIPQNDCALLAQGTVVLSGFIRFVVDHMDKNIDCCDDGEGHGSILCSYSNLTLTKNARISVETVDDTVVVNPGAFWTGNRIAIYGEMTVNLQFGQMEGVNGVLSSTSVYISQNAIVNVSGMKTVRGAAIQGGDSGVILEGTVECRNYTSLDAGGCIAAGKNFSFASTGKIYASNARGKEGSSGLVINGGALSIFQGSLVANDLITSDAGAVIAGDAIEMGGNSSIFARNIIAKGGPSVLACDNIVLRDKAKIVVNGSFGGDSGAIGGNIVELHDNSEMHCENSHADGAGGCIGSTIYINDNSKFIARNVSSATLGGALAGGYPGQYLVVNGTVMIDIDGSSSNLYGGALFFWQNISFSGAFDINIKNTASQCGGAIASSGSDGIAGEGNVFMGTHGKIIIENAIELNSTDGCLSVEANLFLGQPYNQSSIIPQPCEELMNIVMNIQKNDPKIKKKELKMKMK
eukprot:UC4_evm6s1044